jgi:hypothetical protein
MAELIKHDFVFKMISAKSLYNKFMQGPDIFKEEKNKDILNCFYRINDILIARNASEDSRLHIPNARIFTMMQIMKEEDGSKGNFSIAMFIDDNYIDLYSVKLKVLCGIVGINVMDNLHSIYLCDTSELMTLFAI